MPIFMRLALFMLVLIAPAHAATSVRVRAGEHGTFSRILVPNLSTGWTSSRSGPLLSIEFADLVDFDLSAITEKHMAHRVTDARVEKANEHTTLIFEFNCNCEIRTTVNARNDLIIDVGAIGAMRPNTISEDTPPPKKRTELPQQQQEHLAVRERMIAILEEANHSGVVAFKEENSKTQNTLQGSNEQNAQEIDLAESQESAIAGSARITSDGSEVEFPKTDARDRQLCPFPAPYWNENASSYGDILALRYELEGAKGTERERRELDLAKTYLELGFFEEAEDSAAPFANAEDALGTAIYGIAMFGRGNAEAASSILTRFSECSDGFHALHMAAHINASGASPGKISNEMVSAISTMSKPIRAVVAEQLAISSLDHQLITQAEMLYRIASDARGETTSPVLTIVGAALEKLQSHGQMEAIDQNDPALERLAQTRSEYQSRALAELGMQSHGNADSPYDGYLDDISELTTAGEANYSDTEARSNGARLLARQGKFEEAMRLLAASVKSGAHEASPTFQTAKEIFDLLLNSQDLNERYRGVSVYLRGPELAISPQTHIEAARELALIGAEDLAGKALLRAGVSRSEVASALTDFIKNRPSAADNGLHGGTAEFDRVAVPPAHADEIAIRRSLSGLSDGNSRAADEAISEILDNTTQLAIRHMTSAMPNIDSSNIAALAEFADGSTKEIQFMKERLDHE